MKRPEYRVRLFLSADIVGSTAYKSGRGSLRGERQTNPDWVNVTRDFYRKFPSQLSHNFQQRIRKIDIGKGTYQSPVLWKTIGDEIIFSCKLQNLEHLAFCVETFISTIFSYGDGLRALDADLNLKANGWVASFPSRNVTVPVVEVTDGSTDIGSPDELIELEADRSPHRFDFLGTDIDSGFRVGVFSEVNKFSVSCGLAMLLCDCCYHNMSDFTFNYHNRKILKGVIKEHPYPVISLDLERSPSKIAIRNYEHAVTNSIDIKPLHLANFLRSFMADEGIDIPCLYRDAEEERQHSKPAHYQNFVEAWDATNLETSNRDASLERSAIEGENHEEKTYGRTVDDVLADLAAALENLESLRPAGPPPA